MYRKYVSVGAALLVAVLLVLVAAAGCGGDKSSSSGAAKADTSMSADQIVSQSEAKMATVKSGSFTGDVSLAIQGDASKITDPTQKALVTDGVNLHVEGKSADDPLAVDMKMSAGLAGQTIDLSFLAKGKKAWVGYQGKWYVADSKTEESLSTQADVGASPTEQLKSLGLDPSTWGTTYELVGTEDMGGTQVYHVKATADPQKLADALAKAASDPSLAKKLGTNGQELEQGLAQNKAQLDEMKKGLKDVSVDYWIGTDDMLMYKAQFAATLDTTGQKDMKGVDGMTFKASVTMSDFDQPVSVTPPAKALSMDKLMNEMFGGLLGGQSL